MTAPPRDGSMKACRLLILPARNVKPRSKLLSVMLELTSYGLLELVATELALLAIGLVAVQRRVPVPAAARS